MSADTTVVIAAYRFKGASELSYTAKVVQAVENLWYYGDARDSKYALELFTGCPWFRGPGGLRRAKQFASLLAEEKRENGILEYENRPIIEIAEDKVHALSRHGRRRSDGDKLAGWIRDWSAAKQGRPVPHAAEFEPTGPGIRFRPL